MTNSRLRNIASSILFSGRVLYAMELEFKTIGITLGTLKEMEKEWMIAGQSHKTKWLTLK